VSNTVKTFIYVLVLTVAVMSVGNYLGGRQGLLLGFVISLGLNVFSYFYSDQMILKMYRAIPVAGVDPFRLQEIVTKLSLKIGIPKPEVFIIPCDTPNAFATGRNPKHASVAVTEGILRLLSKEELEGVLAHELSHVNHRDTLIMAIAATLGSFIFFGAKTNQGKNNNVLVGLLFTLLTPVAAFFIQSALSRSREYEADSAASELTQNPEALASALWKVHHYSQAVPMSVNPSTAHMFIINPLITGGINVLFSTHPPMQERVKKLIGRTL
jgi:heat shock protein HtpX